MCCGLFVIPKELTLKKSKSMQPLIWNNKQERERLLYKYGGHHTINCSVVLLYAITASDAKWLALWKNKNQTLNLQIVKCINERKIMWYLVSQKRSIWNFFCTKSQCHRIRWTHIDKMPAWLKYQIVSPLVPFEFQERNKRLLGSLVGSSFSCEHLQSEWLLAIC